MSNPGITTKFCLFAIIIAVIIPGLPDYVLAQKVSVSPSTPIVSAVTSAIPTAGPGAPFNAAETKLSSGQQEQQESVRLSSADLRLSPVLPGPRYITGADMNGKGWNSGFMHSISTNPGFAFLASAALPGLGQAANRQWWKTALFVAAEATAIGIYIHRENRGREGERHYEEFGNEHWSVVQYAQYLVLYHGNEHEKSFHALLTDEGKNIYSEGELFGGIDPAFDIDIDWNLIDIDELNQAERNSFYATGFAFSHDLPDYGSQQYYELMSKYFQFGPGWREWDIMQNDQFSIDDGIMPEQFWYHAQVGFDFNDDLSVARNMLTLLVANHFFSAFDAYFTQKLREARVQPTASMDYGLRPTLGFHLRF